MSPSQSVALRSALNKNTTDDVSCHEVTCRPHGGESVDVHIWLFIFVAGFFNHQSELVLAARAFA